MSQPTIDRAEQDRLNQIAYHWWSLVALIGQVRDAELQRALLKALEIKMRRWAP